MTEKSIWSALERMRGHLAVCAEWQALVGDGFEAFRPFLSSILTRAGSLPCNECGCNHKVVPLHDGALASVCWCAPRECRDKILTPEDTVLWQLNWPKLTRAISKSLDLQSKTTHFDLLCTAQIGSWSSDAVPVILTIQWNGHELPRVIAELALRLKRPFILLSPTNTHLTAHCQELLAHANSEFFALDSNLLLTANGTFQPRSLPGEIFARFGPKPHTLPSGSVHPSALPPEYALRKGLGVWKLVFDGKEAELRHERGILYVAWLLANPPEQPIHALDLAAKIPEIYRSQLALTRIADPATGKSAPVQSHARIQERCLSLDDAQSLRVLLRKEKELEAILDDENESEPVKEEALRELEAIAEFQRQHGRRSQDSAQRAVRAVRKAIIRFHCHLLAAIDRSGNPHPVLRPFAAHLEKHLLIPSARYCGPAGARARGPLAGCFTYEPPPGVIWSD